MNELQSIRRAIEEPLDAALTALTPAIPLLTENQFYDENDALSEFCLVRVNFGLMSDPMIGPCGSIEHIRAALIVELFTQKGAGPGRGQEAATAAWQALEALNRGIATKDSLVVHVGAVSGPAFTPLQGRPHFMTRLSAPVRARVPEPPTMAALAGP